MRMLCAATLGLLLTGCFLQPICDGRFRAGSVPRRFFTYVLNDEIMLELPARSERISQKTTCTIGATGETIIEYDDSDVYRSAIHMHYLGFPNGASVRSGVSVRKIKVIDRPFASGIRVSAMERAEGDWDRVCLVRVPDNQFYYEIRLSTRTPHLEGDNIRRRVELDADLFVRIVDSVRVRHGRGFAKPAPVP